MSFTIKFDLTACAERIRKAAGGRALRVTAVQALKDSNFYCKQDQSGLIESSLTHSQPEKGKLIWRQPYAKRQYYLKAASTDKNENASWMWFHKARAEHKKEWLRIYDKAFKDTMSRR